ncbi:2-polyprenyl-6-methoxyphenol hydroxylase-like FAD-dependent oxidoreductase [Paracidovorax anthurii]|uniref:2-polyprenyl-6-methoxyphenol hydroxylase-like FAD-dependent oxidoreductase n=1 Tax=Paracidovorax anthurii TaxID=78229 RepID=A0A328ZJL2_9BURK|nr:flavin-dependent oxidoreductase [Paracidovorax anthurii]RAR85824.1 2-polyprenyl-6-methoxyphenol hydroxylase-like FAD-dependent oxidoreductase [Paracidovorax anthurii]
MTASHTPSPPPATPHPLDIVIAGGGIGGLAAALALADQGHRVTVCEAAARPQPLGVGINLLPHAVAVLDSVGLLPALSAMAVPTRALVFANRHGQPIYEDPRGTEAGYSHPQFSVHRGELQMLLWNECLRRLGADRVRAGTRVAGCSQDAAGVQAHAELAGGGTATLRCDLLIGADGIHSALRRQFHPNEGAPRWNGMMMWRGTTWARPFLDGRTMVQAGHRRAKFVVYPIAPPRADGLQLINWVADRRLREDGFGGGLAAPSREDWSKPGSVDDLLPTFGSWRFGFIDVPGLIAEATQILEWPMVDRDPLPRWRQGRGVTLLGDAAHPMYPIGSNGATQALLDARAIADALAAHPLDLPAALDAYEAGRRPMTARIVELNRAEGLDAILDMVEERAPEGFERIGDVLDPAVLADWVSAYKTAAGHRQTPVAEPHA